MQNNLINLLPHDRIRAFRRMYFLRVSTTALLIGALLIAVHGVLLLPSYTYEQTVIAKQQERLTAIATRPVPLEEQEADAKVKLLQSDAGYLARLGASGTVSKSLRTVLAVARPGITLNAIGFSASTGDKKAEITLSGSAVSRASLRAYVLALSKEPGIENAEVPLGAYASESDIQFSIILMGSVLP